MRIPLISESFSCKLPASDVIEILTDILQKNSDTDVQVVHTSKFTLSFRLRTTHFLERNSFLPYVYVAVEDKENCSYGTVTYSLQKGAKIIIAVFSVFALLLEFLLLCMIGKLATLLPLMIPIFLVVFASVTSVGGLYFFSRRVHNIILTALNATLEQSMKITFC